MGFTLDGNTLTTGSNGLTAEVTLYSGDEYDLEETAPLAYFEGLAGKVVVKVDDTTGSATPANDADAGKVVSIVKGDDGVWVVTVINPRKTFTVTVKKVIAGNMGDRNKTFSFTASYTLGGKTTNFDGFTLGHNGTKEFQVPAGATLNVSETPDGYTPSNDKGTDGKDASFEVTQDNDVVTFTNTKEVVPDTGVTLANAPFIALFCLTVVGCVTLFTARKRRDEEES